MNTNDEICVACERSLSLDNMRTGDDEIDRLVPEIYGETCYRYPDGWLPLHAVAELIVRARRGELGDDLMRELRRIDAE